MRADLDWLGLLETETTRFAAVLEGVDPATRVPSCPDWDAADLLWHLAEVQWFWALLIDKRITDSAAIEAEPDLERPADLPSLRDLQHLSFRQLHNALAQAPVDTSVWTWSADQTVGFVLVRQAHEALIHRVDAELTARDRSPIDPAFAADGITEVLTIMYVDGEPPGADAPVVEIVSTDTGDRWLVRVGVTTLHLVDGETAAASISGTAADLDCWLWNRDPVGTVSAVGDRPALDAFEAVRTAGVQ